MRDPIRSWVVETIRAVEEVQREFSQSAGLLLTEGDLECELYGKLRANRQLPTMGQTQGELGVSQSVHSQVTWFKPDQDSGYKVDLTILDPPNLDLLRAKVVDRDPKKGFFYDGPAVGIELKFIRSASKSEVRNKAREDYEKVLDMAESYQAKIKEGVYRMANRDDL